MDTAWAQGIPHTDDNWGEEAHRNMDLGVVHDASAVDKNEGAEVGSVDHNHNVAGEVHMDVPLVVGNDPLVDTMDTPNYRMDHVVWNFSRLTCEVLLSWVVPLVLPQPPLHLHRLLLLRVSLTSLMRVAKTTSWEESR